MGNEKGVLKASGIRRFALEEQRWNSELLDKMQGIPWEPIPGREGIEIKSRISVPREGGDSALPVGQ